MYSLLTRRHLAAWFIFVSFAEHAFGQDFFWGFQDPNVKSAPSECARLQVFVEPSPKSYSPQPPYYLIAYEANGIPTVQTLGSDPNNLFWNVDHAAGEQLIIGVTDGAGKSGGVAEELFTVATGASTSCHAANPTSPISITSNTTQDLHSCDVISFRVSGGRMPYTITIATRDSGAVTNVSMGVYDTYNWINRASPNLQLIATVSDTTGKYGASTALLSTSGSTDLTCGGLESTFLDSTLKADPSHSGSLAVPKATESAHPPGATPSDANSNTSSNGGNKKSLAAIIGGAISGVVLIGALLAGLYLLLRKRSRSNGPRTYIDHDPYEADGSGEVGGIVGQGNYPDVPLVEVITPSGMASGLSSSYKEHGESQYNQGPYNESSSSSRTDSSFGAPLRSYQYPGSGFTPQLPLGAASSLPTSYRADSHSISTPSFDPYEADGNAPTWLMSDRKSTLVHSISTPEPSERSLSSAQASIPNSTAGPIAGASGSTGLLAGTNQSTDGAQNADVKGEHMPPIPPQNVYQHEDVADVEELPPAYKETTT